MRAILTWHSIDESGSPISVSPAEFACQVAWLQASGVPVLSVADLMSGPADRDAVALTFDDGFANFATEAAPLLLQRGWPVTLCIVSRYVGGDNRWGGRTSPGIPVLPLLDWDGVARLQAAGIGIAAHTRTHPHLARVTDPERLEAELSGCADDLAERLGRRPDMVVYPYGNVSARVAQAAAAHFRWGCTTDLRPVTASDQPLRLPRIDVHYLRAPGRFGPWGSLRLRSWLRLRHAGRQIRALLPTPAAA